MTGMTRRRWFTRLLAVAALVTLSSSAYAEDTPRIIADDATRYLALGDSIASGFKTLPVTNAYPYLLYRNEVFDEMGHTLFANAAVPGATSRDLLDHQVPEALIPSAAGGFTPQRITITIGGNDLLSILHYMQTHTDAETQQFAYGVISTYGQNLFLSLNALRTGLPDTQIYVGNQYGIPAIESLVPLAAPLIAAFNQTVQQVVAQFPTHVHLVDVHAAFQGRRGLLLDELKGVSPFETHMTTAGHRAMAAAFADVIAH